MASHMKSAGLQPRAIENLHINFPSKYVMQLQANPQANSLMSRYDLTPWLANDLAALAYGEAVL